MTKFVDKVVLITGAGRGIGQATAEMFAEQGAQVIVTDRLDDLGEKLVDELDGGTLYRHLDVTQEQEWQRLIQEIKQRFGRLDILVNNAGITGFASNCGPLNPEYASLQDWHAVLRVNLDGVFLGCKYAISIMKHQTQSAIVNISSRVGIVGIPNNAPYSASKAAVRNLTKTVALYCAQQGYAIRCNSVHPGAILTPLWDPWLGSGEQREQLIAEVEKTIPMQKMGTPEDIAAAVLYLASEDAKYVNGSELIVDGGILAGSVAQIQ